MSQNTFRGILFFFNSLDYFNASGDYFGFSLCVVCSGKPGATELLELKELNPSHHLSVSNREVKIATIASETDAQNVNSNIPRKEEVANKRGKSPYAKWKPSGVKLGNVHFFGFQRVFSFASDMVLIKTLLR